MTKSASSRRISASLAAALALCSVSAWAQTPPDQPAPAPPPAAEPPAPPAPPPKVAMEGEPIMKGKSGEIMISKDAWIRIGAQAQVWADFLQSGAGTGMAGTDGSWSNNYFLRRGRAIIAAGYKDANLFMQIDAPRLGLGTAVTALPVTCTTTQNAMTMAFSTTCSATGSVGKRFNASDAGANGALVMQDAWGEIKLAGDAFMIEAGLMVIPFAHNELQSTTTFLTLDVGNVSTQVPFTSGTRDVGFQAKGYVADDKLEYRLGVFSGNRQGTNDVNVLGHNLPRVAGKLQYEIFDPDKGYVYAGHTFGKKKLLGVSAGFDFQKNDDVVTTAADMTKTTTPSGTYLAFSGGVFGAYPLAGEASKTGGDEIAFLAEYYHYSNGFVQDSTGKTTTIGTGGTLPQNDFLVEAAYYNNDAKLSVFGKFEMRKTSFDNETAAQSAANDTQWIGGGLKYYVMPGNIMNFTLFYQNIHFSSAVSGAPSSDNEITLQAQFFVY